MGINSPNCLISIHLTLKPVRHADYISGAIREDEEETGNGLKGKKELSKPKEEKTGVA